MISIRPETFEDIDAVRCVIASAFTNCEFGHNGEADLVDQLRNNCDDLLSLVATYDGTIVGHILFSPVSVRTATGILNGVGLAPMAVVPASQKTGVGTKLIESGLKQLTQSKCDFVVVLGHPDYYTRFGFLPGDEHGFTHGFDGIPQDVFFVKILGGNAKQEIGKGTVKYRSEFGPQN